MIHYVIFHNNIDTLLVFVLKYIILTIFFYLNVLVLAFLHKNRMAPPNTTILIRSQTICSLLMILDMLINNLFEQGPMYDLIFAIFICHIINYKFSYFLFTSFCMEITLLLSIDRFICIVLPFKYKSLRRVYFYMAMVLGFVVGFIITTLFSTVTSVTHKFIKNETIFTCNTSGMNITTFVVVILINGSQTFIFVILNTVTTVHLWKSIKNRCNLSENASNINQDNLSVRFSIFNILSSCFAVVMYFINFIFHLLFIIGLSKDMYFYISYYMKYIYALLTIINPGMYLILM